MKKISEMFSVWVIKQVSGFCGTNHMLNVIYGNMVDICPNCGYSPKKSTHIPCCRDDGRTTMFHKSAEGLVSWMEQQQTDGVPDRLLKRCSCSRFGEQAPDTGDQDPRVHTEVGAVGEGPKPLLQGAVQLLPLCAGWPNWPQPLAGQDEPAGAVAVGLPGQAACSAGRERQTSQTRLKDKQAGLV